MVDVVLEETVATYSTIMRDPPLRARFSFLFAGKPDFWYSGFVKTTLNLPDELVRQIKIRAAQENRKLQDLVAELLRRGLAATPEPRRRVQFPLITGGHSAPSGFESPENLARILDDEEASETVR